MYTQTPQLVAQTVQSSSQVQDRERVARLRGVLTEMSIRDEKVLFALARTVGADRRDGPRSHAARARLH